MTKRKKYNQTRQLENSTQADLNKRSSGAGRSFKLFNAQFFRFLVVGTINTGFSYSVYALLLFFGLNYKLANLAALILGIIFSFITQGRFVFRNTNGKLFFRFAFCWALLYIFNIRLIEFFINQGFDAYQAGAIAVPPMTVLSYFIQKIVIFRKRAVQPETSTIENIVKPKLSFKNTKLSVVVPCYNEEEVLPETNSRLLELMKEMQELGLVSQDSFIYYVDDGSKDKTWELISKFNQQNACIRGIKLSRNRGHQNALIAGLFNADGEAIVSIDADLQDDIQVIKEMIYKFNEGCEIVYGVRSSRETDSFFKRVTAQLYYKLLKTMGVDIIYNHADYRLMSKRVIDCLKDFNEVNLFLRGIIPQLGFNTAIVYYERGERFAGESKYPLSKMLALAADGVTSFSVVPLRMITWIGLGVSLASLAMVVWIFVAKFALEATIPGWASTVLPIYFIGGIQLLSIGILGEYLSKVYMETKQRPRFFIEEIR